MAKRGCQVYANDKNPWSYHYLTSNFKRNRAIAPKIANMDGIAFLKGVMHRQVERVDKVIMNLPGLATQHLPAVVEVLKSGVNAQNTMIYCYTFAKEQTELELEFESLPVNIRSILNVRKVSPNKELFCVQCHLK